MRFTNPSLFEPQELDDQLAVLATNGCARITHAQSPVKVACGIHRGFAYFPQPNGNRCADRAETSSQIADRNHASTNTRFTVE
jgi:hypothetical protein